MTPLDAGAAAEANRLYWETEDSVAEIADRLEISRRALYDAVEPLPTGADCPTCGGPLVFENRSSRTADTPSCVVCAETGATDSDLPVEPLPSTDDERALMIGGAAVAGAALGALVTFLVVPRR